MRLTASAPGSIMITGEHAVVYGHPAIVAAIEQRVRITAEVLAEPRIELHSEIAPPLSVGLENLSTDGPYRFVLSAIALYKDQLPGGVRLDIRSDIDPTLGLGSSAAVTIATLGLCARLSGADQTGLHGQALRIIRAIQGRGSGADLAASLHGGMISYQLPDSMLGDLSDGPVRAQISNLPNPPQLGLCYAGYKTPTAEVLAQIAARMAGNEAEFATLYARMGASATAAIAAAKTANWPAFGSELTTYQALMQQLGVCDETLAQIIARAQTAPDLLAAKISGSGLGDCVVAVGALPDGFTPAPLAQKGLIFHD
ncbi:MAG: mevalonate kinase [Rhodobacterales bacterium]|nr:MAG: mevalonate kinase [Rhodobacterales bacterium]